MSLVAQRPHTATPLTAQQELAVQTEWPRRSEHRACCNIDDRSVRMGGAFDTTVYPNLVAMPVVSDPCAFCSQYRQRLCLALTRTGAAAPKPFLDPQLLIMSARDCSDAMSQCPIAL